MKTAYNLSMAELGYRSPATKLAVVEARTPTVARVISGGAAPASGSLEIAACGEDDFQLFTIAPVLPNGWALLGEPAKWVRVSRQRFSNLSVVGGGMQGAT